MVDNEYLVDDYCDHGSQQSVLVQQITRFVHFISVEFSKYNIELVDLVDFRYLNSTQLSDDRLDRFRGLYSDG